MAAALCPNGTVCGIISFFRKCEGRVATMGKTPRGKRLIMAAAALSSAENGKPPPGVHVHHVFYKGKSALKVNPGRPIFRPLENGKIALEREGTMFLEFVPAIGQRQYDWKQKQIFALSVAEMGTLIGLLPSESCEFYHDPYMGKGDAGKVRKTLKVDPIPDKAGFFFNLNVSNKLENLDVRISIPVTRGEFTVIKSAFNFIIPYLMGWHAHINPSLGSILQVDESVSSEYQESKTHLGFDPTLEWET